jgi:hypothetical protein
MTKQSIENPAFQVLHNLTGREAIGSMRDALKARGLVSGRNEQAELAHTRAILRSYNEWCRATNDPGEFIRLRPVETPGR